MDPNKCQCRCRVIETSVTMIGNEWRVVDKFGAVNARGEEVTLSDIL